MGDPTHKTGSPPQESAGGRGPRVAFAPTRTKGRTGEAGGGARAPRLPGGRPLEAVARGAPPQGRQLAEHAHVAGRRPPFNCQARVNNGRCCQSREWESARFVFFGGVHPGRGIDLLYAGCALFS